MSLRSVCILLIATATVEVLGAWYVPTSTLDDERGCDLVEECAGQDGAPERDHVSSEPTFFFPFLVSAKFDDDPSACPANLKPASVPEPGRCRIDDVHPRSQPLPETPGLHVLCSYLS